MPEKLPRSIPSVDIKLDEKISTKLKPPQNSFDILSSSYRTKTKGTTSSQDYADSVVKKITLPLTLIEKGDGNNTVLGSGALTVSMLGRIILKPMILKQPICIVNGSFEEDKNGSFLTSKDANITTREFFATACKASSLDKPRTWETNLWKSLDSDSALSFIPQRIAHSSDAAILRNKTQHSDPANQIRTGIKSQFFLLPNQPFSFRVQSNGEFSPDYTDFVNNKDLFNKQSYAKFYPKDTKTHFAIEVDWANYKLIYRATSSDPLSLWENKSGEWNKLNVLGLSSLVGDSGGGKKEQTIFVYPMFDKLIFGSGNINDFNSEDDNLVFFQFNKRTIIPETQVTMRMYGGQGQFSFYPIVHPGNVGKALIISSSIPVDFDPTLAFLKLDYEGKPGAKREEAISGVDKELKCITFPQQNTQNDQSDGFGKTSTSHWRNRVEIRYQLFEKGDKFKNLPTSKTCQRLGEPSSKKALATEINGGQFSAAFTFSKFPDNKAPNHEYKWAIQLISKGKLEERVYSPIVDTMQFMAIPPDVILNLNPDPQIDNFDVKKLQITEQSQGMSASFTLINRQSIRSTGGKNVFFTEDQRGARTFVSRGKYIFDFCDQNIGNFTGIKPVTIRGGIKGGGVHVTQEMFFYNKKSAENNFVKNRTRFESDDSNFSPPMRFKGFIVNRSYERPDSAQSDVVCTCDDASRRAKDQISMNLPIFDGWCLAKDTMVLTPEGLIRIDNLSTSHGFDVLTSYDDGTQTIVKNCIAVARGKKQLYKITLQNGQTIRATEDHQFLKRNKNNPRYSCSFYQPEWTRLSQLKINNEIKVSDNKIKRNLIDDQEIYNFDEMLGWMVGDGWYTTTSLGRPSLGILFAPNDEEARKKLKPVFDEFIFDVVGHTNKEQYNNETGIKSIHNCHPEVFKNLKEKYGFKPALAINKELPDYIWNASTQQQCAFLRGLFSADGYASKAHGKRLSIELASNSKKLLEQTQILLSSLGMVSNLIHKKQSKLSDGKDRNDAYALELNGESVISFMRHIKFNLKWKNELWQQPQTPAKSKDFRRIVSIEIDEIEETYDISMPSINAFYANGIYTHNCNLAVIYYLGRIAGYTDDELLMFQDMRNPGSVIRLRDAIEAGGGNPDTLSGGCFDGHIDGIPTDSKIFEAKGSNFPAFLAHALMPLAPFGDQPNYMFQAGQNYWDCMEAIREFTGFYLYPNAYGSIIYQPNEIALKIKNPYVGAQQASKEITIPAEDKTTRIAFFEKSKKQDGSFGPKEYSQYQRSLSVDINTADTRNSLHFQGLIPARDTGGEEWKRLASFSPQVINKIPSEEEFNALIDDPAFAPWIKMGVIKNPFWNDPVINEYLAQQYFNRITRPYVNVSFGAWGQPGIYVYEVLQLDESFMDETGINNCLIVVTEMNHVFDADAKSYTTDITGEMLQLDKFDFSPFVYTIPGFTYKTHTQHPSAAQTAPPGS